MIPVVVRRWAEVDVEHAKAWYARQDSRSAFASSRNSRPRSIELRPFLINSRKSRPVCDGRCSIIFRMPRISFAARACRLWSRSSINIGNLVAGNPG